MIREAGGIENGRCNVFLFKKLVVRQDFFLGRTGRQEFQKIGHTDAVAPDTGATSTFARFNGDPIQQFHRGTFL